MKKIILFGVIILLAIGAYFAFGNKFESTDTYVAKDIEVKVETPKSQSSSIKESFVKIPDAKTIKLPTYVSQTFNNCSVSATTMALNYHGVNISQEKLAQMVRPWNNWNGDNDDKSTIFPELVEAVQSFGLTAYYRPNGTIEILQKFTANDIPVVVRTLTYSYEDYLHFRVVTGYDKVSRVIIQDDSMQGKNLSYSYPGFLDIWQNFNYEYMVLARTPEQKKIIEDIIGAEMDTKVAWENTLKRAREESAKSPNNIRLKYNVVVALYHLGDYEGTVREFEKLEGKLARYTLWYQIEPIEAYFKLKNYDRVISLADSVLNDNNKAVSELYLLKGNVYKERGQIALARAEFEKAVYYNKNWKPAQEALASI